MRRKKFFNKIKEIKENPTTETVLNLLKAGVFVSMVFIAPKAASTIARTMFNKYEEDLNEWEKFDKRKLRKVIKRMVDRKLLEMKKEGEDIMVKLTEKGEEKILKYNLEKLKINKPDYWDGKWRVVIFDIFETKRYLRDMLRRKMQQLGFFRLQNSVFVHPYPCKREIEFLRQVYNVNREVSIFTTGDIEEGEYLRKHFKLN